MPSAGKCPSSETEMVWEIILHPAFSVAVRDFNPTIRAFIHRTQDHVRLDTGEAGTTGGAEASALSRFSAMCGSQSVNINEVTTDP